MRCVSPGLRSTALGHRGGPELVDGRERRVAGLLRRSATGRRGAARSSPSPTWTPATKVVVLGQTVVGQALRRDADPVGQTVRIKNVPFDGGGRARGEGPVAHGPGLRRRGVRPRHHLPARSSRAASRTSSPGAILVGATSADGTHGAQRQITRPAARPAPARRGRRRRRLLDPQPHRDGQRAAGGDAHASPPCSRRSPRSRSSWAASGS